MEGQVTIKKCIVADPNDWRELRRRAVDLGTDASALTRLIVRAYLEDRLEIPKPDAGPARGRPREVKHHVNPNQ